MEYIGLIGLLGLFGVFSGKRLINKFNKLRNDTNHNEENINDVETQVERQAELLIEFQKEIDRLNFVLKNYTTIGELSNFSRQMKREILQEFEKSQNPQTDSEDFKEVFEQRISAIESLNQEIVGKISAQNKIDIPTEIFDTFQKEIEQLKSILKNCATISDLNDISRQIKRELPKNLEQRISALEFEKNKLLDEISAQGKTISQFEQNIKPLINYDDTEKNFEKRISALETEKDKLLDKISAQGKTISQFEQNIKPSTDSADIGKIFEKRISALESDKKKMLDRILSQGKTISQFEQSINSPTQDSKSLIIFEQRISALESDKKNLLDKIAKQEVIIIQYQTKFQDLQKTFDQQIIAYEDRIRQIESWHENNNLSDKFKSNKTLAIQNFQLESIVGPLFTNNREEINDVIHTVENVWGILSFLENSKFERNESFIRVIKNYQQNLQKFTDKIRQGKFDDDLFSEKVTNAFFDTLSKYFLATLPISIYRSSSNDPEFYSEFLKKINEYLTNCHVYTEFIEPKKLIKNDTLEKMQVVKKETSMPDEDKIIDEVERLPYFLDYFTKDNDEESFCFEGKLILLKFNGSKKN